jgi:hypothetical protein
MPEQIFRKLPDAEAGKLPDSVAFVLTPPKTILTREVSLLLRFGNSQTENGYEEGSFRGAFSVREIRRPAGLRNPLWVGPQKSRDLSASWQGTNGKASPLRVTRASTQTHPRDTLSPRGAKTLTLSALSSRLGLTTRSGSDPGGNDF